jgi:solute carrier family 40 (iron-regulated transporter), member 1
MLGSTIVSPAWLLSTDLADAQIMQEWIEPSRRGVINSMQTATCQCAAVTMQSMGVVFHDPHQIQAPVWFSIAAVMLSAVGFSVCDLKFGCQRSVYARVGVGAASSDFCRRRY